MISATNGEGLPGALQAGPTATRPTYRLIQVLRAVAALMVVAHHATIMLQQRNSLPISTWIGGSAGVDIFFVISGFVMTVSSTPLLRSPHPARRFLARRLERIVPLYWIVTSAKLIFFRADPSLALVGVGTTWHVISSFLFLASRNSAGFALPVVVVGWTLNFELLFYVLFACALALRRDRLKFLSVALGLITLFSALPQPTIPYVVQWYENPMVLEFLAGVVLAYFLPQVKKLSVPLAITLLVTGFAVLCVWAAPSQSHWRGLLWGLPASAIVWSALTLEERYGRLTPRWLLSLGDASYSIYLVHGFALPAIGLLLARMGTRWFGVIPVSMAAGIVLSAMSGLLVYRTIELPITNWFKGRRKTAIPAAA